MIATIAWRIILGAFLLAVVGVALPLLNSPGAGRGPMSRSFSNGRQVRLALLLYASDYEGRLPSSLYELNPDYLGASVTEIGAANLEPKSNQLFDWLYFPSPLAEGSPQTILLASPAPTRPTLRGKSRRMVVFSDGKAEAIPEEEFRVRILRESLARTKARDQGAVR